jgi:hypothetical protein
MTDVTVDNGLTPLVASEPTLRRVMGPWLLLLFIIGDILGTGIYALTGQVAKQVGGAVWLPFLLAFVVALITALSYLELVTKYPQAAGAALYTHKAFGIHFVTFIIAFAVSARASRPRRRHHGRSPPTCRMPSTSSSQGASESRWWRWHSWPSSRRSTFAASARA